MMSASKLVPRLLILFLAAVSSYLTYMMSKESVKFSPLIRPRISNSENVIGGGRNISSAKLDGGITTNVTKANVVLPRSLSWFTDDNAYHQSMPLWMRKTSPRELLALRMESPRKVSERCQNCVLNSSCYGQGNPWHPDRCQGDVRDYPR